jgi:DNA-binding LacI/PurR family transcriptional regulator
LNLEDVARKAGVSRSTVSRVINDDPHVSQGARDRVMNVIRQENFQPNPAARALVTRRSNIIGVAIPQTVNVFWGDDSYFPMLLQGIANTINREDFAMLFWLAESQEHRESFARRVIRHRQSDGLLIASVIQNDPLFEHLRQHKRRFVMVESPPHHAEETSYVTVDNAGAAKRAVEHLFSLGRRRIATITGQIDIQDAVERLKGYEQGLLEAGLPVDQNLIYYGRFDRLAGYDGMKQLLQYKPDAVFAGGDTAALGAIRAIREAGLHVPDDIAVVGFDDLDVATHSEPSLTTIRHNVQTVGSTAAKLLIDLIEERLEHPQHIIVPTELVVRASTVGSG